jgi:N-acetylglucosaminyl-diphospho-decaprenol L-rhamnosyltransferase
MMYFVTVNYYSTALIGKLIQSIELNIRLNYKIIIVNNSCLDVSVNQLRDLSNVVILNPQENLGFGKGCNIGINHIYSIDPNALIWLINPDAIIHKDAKDYIFECLEQDSSIAILGTKIQDAKGGMWFSSGDFNQWTGDIKHRADCLTKGETGVGTIKSRWVCGCSLIINLARLGHCPSFDPNYFLYCEDTDLCERYYQKGYHIAVTNHILVTHQVSSIIGRNRNNMYRHYTFSRLYFLKQHSTQFGLLIYAIYTLIKVCLLLPIDLLIALGIWEGFKEFFTWLISTKN